MTSNERNSCAMATYYQTSDLVGCIAPPTSRKPGLGRVAALRVKEQKQLPIHADVDAKEIDDIFYQIQSPQRNPWVAIGSYALLSALLLTLSVIPLFHTDALPKRQTLTMLYLPPAPAAAGNTLRPRTAATPTYISRSTTIHAPRPETQEAPPPPLAAAGGVVGGVSGGVPGGVLNEVLGRTGSAPVLAKVPEPT